MRVGKTLRDRNCGQGVNKVMNCLHQYQVREENILQTERRHRIERESITAIGERRVTSPGTVLANVLYGVDEFGSSVIEGTKVHDNVLDTGCTRTML